MARQQRFDWFLSQHRRRKNRKHSIGTKPQRQHRQPNVELLEARELLSVNGSESGPFNSVLDDVATALQSSNVVYAASANIAHDHNGDGIADHSAQDHDPGCCCEQCLGIEASTGVESHLNGGGHNHSHPDGYWYVPEGEAIPDEVLNHTHDHESGCCCDECLAASGIGEAVTGPGFSEFTAQGSVWEDGDPDTDGIQITYSYSNLFDGGIRGGISNEAMIAATEEAFALWASVTPLHFIEVTDSGPLPDPNGADEDYPAEQHPDIRIGHHFIDGDAGANVLAHAYFPPPTSDGQAGDVHFDNGNIWNIGLFLETMIHELGHSLGLGHEPLPSNGGDDAIMNPIIQNRFPSLGTGYLLQDDIDGIQFLYGDGEGSVSPLRLVVSTNVDEDDGDYSDGDLSLREALVLAKEFDRAQLILFDESLMGQTIDLDPTLGALVVDNSVTIEGLGADQLSIVAADTSEADGDGFQIFVVESAEEDVTIDVFISGLSLVGGDSATDGGAIFAVDNLTLDSVSIEDNYSAGSGGAIYSTAKLTVRNSTLANNRSDGDGGAIASEGEGNTIIVNNSTLSANSAAGDGGAIYSLDENPRLLRVLNSTIYDNHADSDNNNSGTGGGIWMLDGVLALENSIVAMNTDRGIAPNIDNVNPFAIPKVLAKYSLVSDVAGSFLTQQAPNLLGVDPLLLPLADNGGPTHTHLPEPGSPILNAGNPNPTSVTEFDQRGLGFRRILEGIQDIGAVESGGFVQSFTVNSLLDTSDVTALGVDATPEVTTLREAIEMANQQLGKNLINFDGSLNGGTIELNPSLGELQVTDTMTLDASGLVAGLTISALTTDPTPLVNNGDGTRLLRIDDSEAENYLDVEIFGVMLTGGDVTGHGGAIYSVENLSLTQVSVLDSYAVGNGGGVYHLAGATGGTLMIDSSTLAGNYATQDGGGLWSNTNLAPDPESDPDANPFPGLIVNSTVSGNEAGDEGGGIMNFDGQLEIRHSTITQNVAAHGSGIVSFGDSFTKTLVYSSIISGNFINDNGTPINETDDFGFDVQRSKNVAFNSFESLGYNLIGTGNALMSFNNDDITEVLDPLLRPLGNYGGKTMTHLPLSNSPAIDASDPSPFLSDYGVEVLANDPYLYWQLDEVDGEMPADTFSDVAGINHGSPANSGPGTSSAPPTDLLGQSRRFNENGAGLFSPSFTDADLGGTFSISIWFNVDTLDSGIFTERHTLLTLESENVEFQLNLRDSGAISSENFDNQNGAATPSSIVSEATWHHLVYVQDGSEVLFYLDGTLVHSEIGTPFELQGSTFMTIGGYRINQFSGSLDEVTLFSHPLEGPQVLSLFESASGSTAPTPVIAFDQRGEGFTRIIDGDDDGTARLDIGAVEAPTPEPDADFDNDNDIDGSDFLAWQRGFNSIEPTKADGDSNADGTVDADDLAIWFEQYGEFGPADSLALDVNLSVQGPSLDATRTAHRPAQAGGYNKQEILLAAAQSYSARDLDSRDDSMNSDLVEEASPRSIAADPTDSTAPYIAFAAKAENNKAKVQFETDAAEESDHSLDEAFASLGVEQPMRWRGV